MVFEHYRQLVRDSEAADWFSIKPTARPGDVVLMPTAADGHLQLLCLP
jgi:hypothetical protein